MGRRPVVVKAVGEVILKKGTVTFVFAAGDEEHNDAVALREFLESNP
jgi:uncharacterized protein YeaO (DUF488 family)